MRRSPSKLVVLASCALALLFLASVVDGVRSRSRLSGLSGQLQSVEADCQRRLGASTVATDIVVRAPFASWAAVTSGLHRAKDLSGLTSFAYETGTVIDCESPDTPLTLPPDDAEETGTETGTPPVKAPYRAMTCEVSGAGSYEAVVRFVGLLASADPPLTLDELTIHAGPDGPSFEGQVHLTTALQVAPPRDGKLGELMLADLLAGADSDGETEARQ